MNPIILLVIFTAILNAAAQLLLKAGMTKIGSFKFVLHDSLPVIFKIISSPFIVIGLIIYIISVSLWLLVLSRIPVNIAYPLTSLAYVFNLLGAYFIFKETLTLTQGAGMGLIIFGVYLIGIYNGN